MNAHEAALLAWQPRCQDANSNAPPPLERLHGRRAGYAGSRRFLPVLNQRLGGSGEVKLIDVGEGVEFAPMTRTEEWRPQSRLVMDPSQ